MAIVLHDSTSHRNDPEIVDVVHRENLDRYRFAAPYCREQRVLEVGCSFGHGTKILASVASAVDAVDIYEPAVAYARQCNLNDNVQFHLVDACDLPFRAGEFDVVVTFEVIEHVEEPQKFLLEILRVLKPGGRLILSTPNGLHSRQPNGLPGAPTHLREYLPQELEGELTAADYSEIQLQGQILGPEVWQVYNLTAQASWCDRLRLRRWIPGWMKRNLLAVLVRIRYRQPVAQFAQTQIDAAHVSDSFFLIGMARKPTNK